MDVTGGAVYSNGMEYHYTYDAAGNVMSYETVVDSTTNTTTYTYDDANQLATATDAAGTWYYTYDGNGNLTQASPAQTAANGAKQYTYNTANMLVKVETYNGSQWETQAEMENDGMGHRLEMTAYAGTTSVTTEYVFDYDRTLSATSGTDTTFYLYGVGGVIGELTDDWVYGLSDGSNTQRQLTDENGTVSLASSYTPWGDILSVQGDGGFTFGYFGSMMDAATGLLYIGNGQYYDPATGRFINGGNQMNNLPVMVDPAGMFIAPLSLLPLMFSGKKKKKRTKLELLLILMVVSASLGISLTACMPNFDYINNPPPDLIPTPAPLKRENLSYSTTTSGNLPSQTYAPTLIPVVQYRCISPVSFLGAISDPTRVATPRVPEVTPSGPNIFYIIISMFMTPGKYGKPQGTVSLNIGQDALIVGSDLSVISSGDPDSDLIEDVTLDVTVRHPYWGIVGFGVRGEYGFLSNDVEGDLFLYTGVPNGNVEAGISFSEDFETKEVSQKLYIAGTAGKVTVEGFIEIYEYPHIEQRNILAHSSQIDKAGGLDAYLDKMKIISGTNVTILRLDLPTDEAMGGFASLHNQFKRKASFYNSASLYLESDHSNIIQSPQFSSQIGYWVVSDEYDL